MPRDSEILKSNKLYLTLPLLYPNQQVEIKDQDSEEKNPAELISSLLLLLCRYYDFSV